MLANEDSVMLDQERAREAYEEVSGLIGSNSGEKFRSYAIKAPSMLLSCGLVQTCAFLLDKEEKVFKALARWLKLRGYVESKDKEILGDIVKMTPSRYRLAESEALAYLGWLKRMSEIHLKKDKGNKGKP
jgi:CRISPR-associated protein Cmr5